MVVCPHCERGPSEVPCEKCEAPILGKWLTVEEPEPTDPVNHMILLVIIVLTALFAWLISTL